MSQHEDDLQIPLEVQNALRQDSQSITSPPALDKRILAMANKKASRQAQLQRKHRFGFWHYCAAASTAGFLVLGTSYLTRQPEMVDAVSPSSIESAILYSDVQQSPEVAAQPKPQPSTEETARQYNRAREAATQKEQKRKLEQDRELASQRLMQARRVTREAVLADSAVEETVDCRELSIPQALAAQKTYVDSKAKRLLAENPDVAKKVNTWHQKVVAGISSEQRLYQQLLNSGVKVDANWKESWWLAFDRVPDHGAVHAEDGVEFDTALKCAEPKPAIEP